jgi:hypothetical protein
MTDDTPTPETIAIISGPCLRTPEDWLVWCLTCWGWYCGYETWFGTLRALVRSLRGLEAAGVLVYNGTLDDAGRPRRSIELTERGEALARWLVAKGREGAAS